jgi:hypothetical protein
MESDAKVTAAAGTVNLIFWSCAGAAAGAARAASSTARTATVVCTAWMVSVLA